RTRTRCAFAGILREQLGSDAAAEKATPLGQGQPASRAGNQAEPLQPLESGCVHGIAETGERKGLVQPQAKQDSLPALHRRRQLLELALRPLSRLQRGEVAPETRR